MKDSCINCNSIIHVAVVDDDNTFIERYTMMVDGFMKKNGLECYVRGKAENWQEKGDSEG